MHSWLRDDSELGRPTTSNSVPHDVMIRTAILNARNMVTSEIIRLGLDDELGAIGEGNSAYIGEAIRQQLNDFSIIEDGIDENSV